MIAAVHIQLPITLPLAGLVAMALWAYWRRLGEPDIQPDRKRIRRVTTAVMGLCVPLLVLGLSVYDPVVAQRGYLLTWSAVIALLVVVLLGAMFDMANNLRLHRQGLEHDIRHSLRRIDDATKRSEGDHPAGGPAT